MKILLGNNTLSILAGSETWTYTLALALKKLGHEVTAFSTELGTIAMKMSAEGIDCVSEVGGDDKTNPYNPFLEEPKGDFDVIICNHYEISRYLRSRFPKTPMIATIHGILHQGQNGEIWPEHPAFDAGVNKFISVSEEVQDILKKEYNLESEIIRNFYDLDRFKKIKKLPAKPSTILVNSNYWGVDDPVNMIIREVATILACKLLAIGANFAPTFEVEKILEEVDIVFGMGRSAFEGAVMGKLSVIHGRWGTGGVLTPESYPQLKIHNFSGRVDNWQNLNPVLYPAKEIADSILANFNQNNSDELYKIIKKDHNAIVAAKRYVEIAEGLIKK